MKCLKPLENEIVEQTDYSRHTYAQLLAEIEHYADIMRGASPMHLDWVMAPARALVARAEAAEAARDSCYREAGKISEYLATANNAVEVFHARAEAAEARASETAAASFVTAAVIARIGRILGIDSTLPVEAYCEATEARVAELEARAEAAEAERDDANIEAALEQSNAREAWQRVAELEAAQQWRNTLVGFLARDDAWRICLTAMLWTESGQAKTPRIAASLRDVFGHTLNAEIPEDAAIEGALREMERWFSAPSRLEEPTP